MTNMITDNYSCCTTTDPIFQWVKSCRTHVQWCNDFARHRRTHIRLYTGVRPSLSTPWQLSEGLTAIFLVATCFKIDELQKKHCAHYNSFLLRFQARSICNQYKTSCINILISFDIFWGSIPIFSLYNTHEIWFNIKKLISLVCIWFNIDIVEKIHGSHDNCLLWGYQARPI